MQENRKLTFIDLFAGIGGFRHGMELAGHKCVGFCEWDKFATASYTSMHLITDEQREYLETLDLKKRQKEILRDEYRNGEWYANDIRDVNAGNVPKCDCWCFGAPCQDFSVAGKRAGLGGGRSSLVREVFRIIGEIREEDRPEWLIYENVKGMLSSNRGFDFLAILLEMDELGYDLEWFTFNSKYHGVPQNRERVYTVGHLRARGVSKIFPIKGTSGEDNLCGIDIIGHRDGYRRNTQVFSENGVAETLSTCGGGGREHHVAIKVIGSTKPSRHSDADVHDTSGIMSTCCGRDYKHPKQIAIPISPDDIDTESGFNQRNVVHSVNGVSRTLIGGGGSGGYHDGNQPKVGIPMGFNAMPDGACRTLKYQYQKNGGTNVRSEYGKEIRKQYENGEIDISSHEFLEKEIRRDGVSNTVDSVQKDNLLAVGVENNQGADHPGIYVQLSEDCTVYAVQYEKYGCYIAIRKLTPKECFRLQGWTDDYFKKAQFVNSDSQLYKQAGNGVTVNVVYEIGKAIAESEVK